MIHTLSPLSGHYRCVRVTQNRHTNIYGFEGLQRSTFTNSSTSSPSAGSTCIKSRLAKPRLPYGGTCSCYSPSTFAHIDTPHRIEHLAKFKKAQSHALGEVKRKVKSGLGVVTGKWKGGEKKKKEEPQNRPRDSQTQEEKGGGEELAKEKEKGKGKEQVEERKDESQKSQPQPQEEGEEEEEEELTKDSRAGPGPESTEGKSEGKDPLKSEPKAKIAEEPSVSPLPTSPGSPRSDG